MSDDPREKIRKDLEAELATFLAPLGFTEGKTTDWDWHRARLVHPNGTKASLTWIGYGDRKDYRIRLDAPKGRWAQVSLKNLAKVKEFLAKSDQDKAERDAKEAKEKADVERGMALIKGLLPPKIAESISGEVDYDKVFIYASDRRGRWTFQLRRDTLDLLEVTLEPTSRSALPVEVLSNLFKEAA